MAAVAKIEEHKTGEVVSLGETSTMLAMLNRMTADASVSIERVEQAFAFYQKVQANDARRAFDEAMAIAKSEIKPILKNRLVSHETKTGGTKATDMRIWLRSPTLLIPFSASTGFPIASGQRPTLTSRSA